MDRRAIATLSAGHGGVDFVGGAIPALIPFLVAEFDLDYLAAGALILAVTVSSSLVQPLFGFWSDRRGALWLLPGGLALASRRRGARRARPRIRGCPRVHVRRRDRDRRVPPRGGEVRGLREHCEACERDVALQRGREPRLRARADHRDAARSLARARRRRARGDPGSVRLRAARALASGSGGAPADAQRGVGRAGRDAGRPDGDPGRRDRASQRRLVRVARLRAALGRVRGRIGGRGQPRALAHARRRRRRDARSRADRRPCRATAHARRHAGRARAARSSCSSRSADLSGRSR